jgi:hypothetical protein
MPPPSAFDAILTQAAGSELRKTLDWAIEPLAEFEDTAISRALQSDLDPLCSLLDHGSILAYQLGDCSDVSSALAMALKESCDRLRAGNLFETSRSLVTRHYGGIYFSYTQAVRFDALLDAVSGHTARDALLAPVLSAASDSVNTVGKQFAQPIRPRSRDGRPKAHLLAKIRKDRGIDPFAMYRFWSHRFATLSRPRFTGEAVRADYEAFLRRGDLKLAAIYADPPYTRDHYSRYYHVLETMCLRDDPEVTSTAVRGPLRVSRGIYRKDRHQSPFCIQSKAADAFDTLFAGARRHHVPLIVSYSPFEPSAGARPRLMSIDGIIGLARRHYGNVELRSLGKIAHSKLRSTEREVGVADEPEVLLICQP